MQLTCGLKTEALGFNWEEGPLPPGGEVFDGSEGGNAAGVSSVAQLDMPSTNFVSDDAVESISTPFVLGEEEVSSICSEAQRRNNHKITSDRPLTLGTNTELLGFNLNDLA